MFDMLTKFLKTYTIWGQYIQEKHFNIFYYVLVFGIFLFLFLNILLYF